MSNFDAQRAALGELVECDKAQSECCKDQEHPDNADCTLIVAINWIIHISKAVPPTASFYGRLFRTRICKLPTKQPAHTQYN